RLKSITANGLLSAAITLGTIAATLLVAPAAWGLVRFNLVLGLIVSLAIVLSLRVCWSNVVELLRSNNLENQRVGVRQRWLLLGALPITLVGSVFDCSGFRGCTSICYFLNTRVVPALIVLTALYLFLPRRLILFGLTATSFVLLVPSCRCYNPVN